MSTNELGLSLDGEKTELAQQAEKTLAIFHCLPCYPVWKNNKEVVREALKRMAQEREQVK